VPSAFAGDDGQVCLGQWFPVWSDGGEEYLWSPPQFAANPTEPMTAVSPPESMNMTVYVTDEYGCVATDEVFVNVLPLPEADAGPDRKIDWMDSAHLFGYADGIDFWWTPDLWIECTDCLQPEIQPDESLHYYIETIDENGCIGRDSAFVEIFYPIYVPNTFTPDGDGLNEIFQAYGDNIQNFRMEIYDRWGQMIFVSEDINKAWTGAVQDGDHYVQIDTYVWMIWFDALEGRKKLVGHVNVIR
ncbi:MAG: T9SS type B sorting domain-containing protein, partial [Flavobacteriales bacterium]|nr:T9SS type B sorting domain-containing protein [Flavobacteriales bacterium]